MLTDMRSIVIWVLLFMDGALGRPLPPDNMRRDERRLRRSALESICVEEQLRLCPVILRESSREAPFFF